ncbi:hypothetical protein R4Z09_23120 [Niallia oryzisoli]|uniref:Uncharacterized protein n=1 Tax=Niallia oryzisoli TaxID=1737571 RepID=A0ABZ2C906_9BACI
MKKVIIFFSFLLFFQSGNAVEGMSEQLSHAVAAEDRVENHYFKDIVVSKKNGQYVITGKSKVKKGVFYYNVEDGHRVWVPETKVRVNNLYWTYFKLSVAIPTKNIPDNGVLILNLYEKDRSKEITDHFPVVLERFKD